MTNQGTELWWAVGASRGGAAPPLRPAMSESDAPLQAASPSVRLEFEGFRLGASYDDVMAQVTARDWRHSAVSAPTADQGITVAPPPEHLVRRFRLGLQGGAVVSIRVDYTTGDPARVAALRLGYPRGKPAPDGCTFADAGGLTLVFIDNAGRKLHALYTGMMRDRAEVAALFRTTLHEAPTGGPAVPPVIP